MSDHTPLSPAAQAVLDAAREAWITKDDPRSIAAAALRAAADQVFPLERTPWGSTLTPVLASRESRNRLLAITIELEKGNE